MPFRLATIPFTPEAQSFGVFAVGRQRAITVLGGAASRLSTSIAAFPPGGSGVILSSIGFDAGLAPTGTTRLNVVANGVTIEHVVVTALGGVARASTGLRVFVEEFSGTGSFLRSISGPTIALLDSNVLGLGGDVRSGERQPRAASAVVPVAAGRFYRVWVDMMQAAGCQALTGWGQAVNNFIFDFTPVFFDFA